MERLKNLMEEIEKRFGCSCCFESDGKTILLETESPENQDVVHEFTIPKNSENPAADYLEDLKQNAAYFDPDEEASYWIGTDGHGKNGAPYRLSELVKDMEWAENFFTEVARFAELWMDGKIVEPLYKRLTGRPIKEGDFIIGHFGCDPFDWEDATEEDDCGWSVELTDNCNVDEIFGTYVETEENDAYLNIYAHVSADLFNIRPYLTVTYNEDGSPHDFEEYKRQLSDSEQKILLSMIQKYAGNILLQKANGI